MINKTIETVKKNIFIKKTNKTSEMSIFIKNSQNIE